MFREAIRLYYAHETVKVYAWVVKQFPPVRRLTELDFSHHLEVASLEPADQDILLARAQEERWSSRELREAVREYKRQAERKLGGLLEETVDHKGGDSKTLLEAQTALPEGISRSNSHRWQTEALVPDEEF